MAEKIEIKLARIKASNKQILDFLGGQFYLQDDIVFLYKIRSVSKIPGYYFADDFNALDFNSDITDYKNDYYWLPCHYFKSIKTVKI